MATLELHLNKQYGYSCQTWLAKYLSDNYFGGKYRIWFATEIHPLNNGLSSNPLRLYEELSRITATNDYNHSRIVQLKRNLIMWVASEVSNKLTYSQAGHLIGIISKAPVKSFRPLLWRIELSRIHVTRLQNIGQFPDEYLIGDLDSNEYEVIVDA
ncbi:hypothetical protein EHQ52_17050 [Leptospira koniambonensis]|uniref:Uncharacterized protein n=1 Tax=Leptospira koniambonensis TaxID=2484950 RepID=A0A4R9J4R3_9LEPT|nr:hypothetical protein [Leptospira koniambonensis]TGL31634.1 hypothetical protein EHQ52_17050 [Leptospira koniambonensis]